MQRLNVERNGEMKSSRSKSQNHTKTKAQRYSAEREELKMLKHAARRIKSKKEMLKNSQQSKTKIASLGSSIISRQARLDRDS